MFAVPGWSVSADALKTQEDPAGKKQTNDAKVNGQNGPNKSRKRKRGHSQANGVSVTEGNLADLWRKHIEGRSQLADDGARGTEKKKKKRRKEHVHNEEEAPPVNSTALTKLVEDLRESQVDIEEGKIKTKKNGDPKTLAAPVKSQAVLESVNGESNGVDSKKAAKTKFEERKRKALEKKEKKAILQANSAIPPARPPKSEDAAAFSNNHGPPSIAKPTESHKISIPLKVSNVPTPTSSTKAATTTPKAKPISPQAPPKPPTQVSTSKLTPLQQSMQSKLISARFRHLNQTLYTTPSAQASKLFSETPSAFSSYHAGFRAQVAVWPQNPVDTFIEDVNSRGKVGSGRDSQKKLWKQERKGKGKGKGTTEVDGERAATDVKPTKDLEPLPRTRGTCTLADLGCGDASFAAALKPLSSSLHLRLHSFDLAQGDGPNAPLITVADISNLPLADGSVDIAIFCLALMGTNWVDFVEEAARVVRWGGECWVAEIKSRFGRPAPKKKASLSRKKGEEEEEVAEVDEELGPKEGGKTDVSAFVDVWRRRGFELKGEADLGNKMFVRMRFVKKLTPTRGKGVFKDEGLASARDEDGGKWKAKGKKRFWGDSKEEEDVDEAKVLKPCVYKIR